MDLESFSEKQILSCFLMTNWMGKGEVERPNSDSAGPEDVGSAQFTPFFKFSSFHQPFLKCPLQSFLQDFLEPPVQNQSGAIKGLEEGMGMLSYPTHFQLAILR